MRDRTFAMSPRRAAPYVVAVLVAAAAAPSSYASAQAAPPRTRDLDSLTWRAAGAGVEPLAQHAGAPPEPCMARPESRAFDFWIGEWDVRPAGDETQPIVGHSVIQRIAGGCALLENWSSVRGTSGKSLNAYNQDLKHWQQFWVDQVGSVTEYRDSEMIEGGGLRFYTWGIPNHGDKIRLTFSPLGPDLVRQHAERSTDGGRTWTTQYDFYYRRQK